MSASTDGTPKVAPSAFQRLNNAEAKDSSERTPRVKLYGWGERSFTR
jgi:hypothetical protein